MSLLTREKTDTELRRLHPEVVSQIVDEARDRMRPSIANEPPQTHAYDPRSGAWVGSVLAGAEGLDRVVLVADDWSPEGADLEAVRLDSDGRVVVNVQRPAPEVKPEPEPLPPLVHAEGRPLDPLVADRIVVEHRRRVPPWVVFLPGHEPANPLPAVPHGYKSNGDYAGTTWTPEVASRADHFIVLLDTELPSPEELVRWVRIHPADGRVTMVRT